VTLTTSILGIICPPELTLDIAYTSIQNATILASAVPKI